MTNTTPTTADVNIAELERKHAEAQASYWRLLEEARTYRTGSSERARVGGLAQYWRKQAYELYLRAEALREESK